MSCSPQAWAAATIVTLKVEKEQISALADYVAGLLSKLPEPGSVDQPNTDS